MIQRAPRVTFNFAAGTHLCGSTCVPDTSVATCGTSCLPCPVPANGAATCVFGMCGLNCTTPFVVSGGTCTTWQQKAYLKANNADASDEFGWSVSLSDDGQAFHDARPSPRLACRHGPLAAFPGANDAC